MDVKELWKNALAALEVDVSKANFATFLSSTELTSLESGKAIITCPNKLIVERLKKHYGLLIEKALTSLTGDHHQTVFQVKHPRHDSQKVKISDLGPLFTESKVRNSGLFPSYTFENFVVGLSNQLAHAAAAATASQPGTLHNPLLFHGGVGLGKTHLMHAVGNAVKKDNPEANICYCPAERFTNEMIEAIQSRRTAALFRRKYRSADVLLIDDIQFLAGREATQEEFFNTFNELYLSRKQIILTSDRHPQEIKDLEERLISRFSGGMVADIQTPDLDLRTAILRQKAQEHGQTIDNEILLTLARQIAGSIRQLEGALTQLLLLIQTHQGAAPSELINLVVQNNADARQSTNPCPNGIVENICNQFGVDKKELCGPKRTKEIKNARQAAMYVLRQTTSLPLEKIGDILGRRDHSTVLHGINVVEERLKTDSCLKQKLEKITDTTHPPTIYPPHTP